MLKLQPLFQTLFKIILSIPQLLFWATLWLIALGLIAWFPLRWWPGDRFVPVQLLNYFMPWLLLALLPALTVATLTQRKWLTGILLIPTVIIMLSYAPLFLPRSNIALADSTKLKVMSYNIWGHNHNFSSVAGIIKEQQPDIVLIQELNRSQVNTFQQELIDLYPDQTFHFAYQHHMRQAIVSRYPLTPVEAVWAQGRAQKAIVHLPQQDAMLVNVHFSQPVYWENHYDEMKQLIQSIQQVDLPLIVGGDFNTTEQSQVYRMLDQHLSNAHWEAGWGFGFSFPAKNRNYKGVALPRTALIRIDHLFYNQSFLAYSAHTLNDSGGSDHFPIVAQLELID